MAYKITQHRRGTYEEWLESNAVPYEGELIIVEFDNNVRKCKIGDGITTFSDLPYLTDWVMQELVDKIDALQELTDSELDAAITELYQKIEEIATKQANVVSEMKSDINKQIAEVNSNINILSEDLAKVDGIVKTLVEPAVGELDAKYSEELSQITRQHTADQEALQQAIEDKAIEITSFVDKAIEQNTIKATEALETVKSDLAADYTSKIAENALLNPF